MRENDTRLQTRRRLIAQVDPSVLVVRRRLAIPSERVLCIVRDCNLCSLHEASRQTAVEVLDPFEYRGQSPKNSITLAHQGEWHIRYLFKDGEYRCLDMGGPKREDIQILVHMHLQRKLLD